MWGVEISPHEGGVSSKPNHMHQKKNYLTDIPELDYPLPYHDSKFFKKPNINELKHACASPKKGFGFGSFSHAALYINYFRRYKPSNVNVLHNGCYIILLIQYGSDSSPTRTSLGSEPRGPCDGTPLS